MEDFIEKYKSISDLMIKQLNEFCNEANKIHEKISEIDSVTLTNVLQSIDNVCSDICKDLMKISNMHLESIKLSMQYQEKLFERSHKRKLLLKDTIDNLKEEIIDGPKFWDIINLRVALVNREFENINELDKTCDYTAEMNDLLNLLNLKIVQINIMQCCLPFSINDYGKYQAKKQQLGEAIKFALGFIPGVSEVVAFADFISIIEKSADIENQNDLEVDFYNEIDDNLKILEQQLVMLNTMKKRQEDIVTYFENHCKDEKEKLELLETMK